MFRIRPTTCLPLIAASLALIEAPGTADRDIVYSGQYFKWTGKYFHDDFERKPKRTYKSLGPNHLYRISANGKKRVQITFGKGSEIRPRWSPDGKQISFIRVTRNERRVSLCVADENGSEVREVLLPRMTDLYIVRLAWSPDGHRIAVYPGNYTVEPLPAFIYDLRNRRMRRIEKVSDCVWSPDGSRVYISSKDRNGDYRGRILSLADHRNHNVAAKIRFPIWHNSHTIIGSAFPEGDNNSYGGIRWLHTDGSAAKVVRLCNVANPKAEGYIFALDGRWARIPKERDLYLFEAAEFISDGPHWYCYRVNIKTGAFRKMCDGMIAGVSPDGKYMLSANWEWEGPYKRGGTRCGPLVRTDLRTGRKRLLTGRLVEIDGGDWRRSNTLEN